MITFAWPWIFLLLPLPLAARFLKKRSGTSQAIRIPQRLEMAFGSVESPSYFSRHSGILLLWLSWIALLFALSQPAIPSNNSTQPASGRTIMLAMDLSSSMERKDFMLHGEAVDRLTVVKQVAQAFILARKGDRIGLVLFSSDTFIASPPSFDLQSVAYALTSAGAGMAGRTTAIGDGIGMAISSLRNDPATQKVIVLLSDGTNNAGSVEPESAARLAQQLGIAIHTIGMGSDGSASGGQISYAGAAADLDEATLESIAQISGGRFFRATNSAQLADIYNEIDKLEGSESKPPAVLVQRSLSQVFVLLLFVLTLLYLSISVRHKAAA